MSALIEEELSGGRAWVCHRSVPSASLAHGRCSAGTAKVPEAGLNQVELVASS